MIFVHNKFVKKIFSDLCNVMYRRHFPILKHGTDVAGWKSAFRLCHSKSRNSIEKNEDLEKSFYVENILPTLEGTLMLGDLAESDLMLIFRRFGMKGLDVDCLKKYNVRVSCDFTRLLFLFHSSEKLSGIQTMVWSKEDIRENVTKSFVGLDDQSLFGWSLVDSNDKELVVTSDPLDAIAVNQSTNLPAVSIPFISSLPYTFSKRLLGFFSVFNKVIFWMKQDLHSFGIHKLLGSALKKNGCFIWHKEYQNPMFCLQNGSNTRQILKKTYPLYDERLKYIDEFKDSIYEELFPEKVSGVKWKRFTALNDLLKGHRSGELTVFTGQTGTGKTTFMCEYSLDLCLQGVPTLWINLEIPHSRLLRTMLCQFSKCSSEEVSQSYDIWLKKFKETPMIILNFSDRYSIKEILNAMICAVRLNSIQHIIVDNLQFMMYMGENISTLDHLRAQDKVYSAFREFATLWNCHVTVIIHPRKEAENSELTVSSISGTAKATQEADNILILQTSKTKQYLQVAKNRFDGEKGCVILEFNKRTYTYTVKKMGLKTKMA